MPSCAVFDHSQGAERPSNPATNTTSPSGRRIRATYWRRPVGSRDGLIERHCSPLWDDAGAAWWYSRTNFARRATLTDLAANDLATIYPNPSPRVIAKARPEIDAH